LQCRLHHKAVYLLVHVDGGLPLSLSSHGASLGALLQSWLTLTQDSGWQPSALSLIVAQPFSSVQLVTEAHSLSHSWTETSALEATARLAQRSEALFQLYWRTARLNRSLIVNWADVFGQPAKGTAV